MLTSLLNVHAPGCLPFYVSELFVFFLLICKRSLHIMKSFQIRDVQMPSLTLRVTSSLSEGCTDCNKVKFITFSL